MALVVLFGVALICIGVVVDQVWLALLGCVPLAVAPSGVWRCPGPGRRGRMTPFAPSAAGAGMGPAVEQGERQGVLRPDVQPVPPREAIEQYAGAEYLQHNPRRRPTARKPSSSTSSAWRGVARQARRVQARHRRGRPRGAALLQHWPGDHDYAGIDIFRFDDDGQDRRALGRPAARSRTLGQRQRDVLVAGSA